MVDISDRIARISQMVEDGKYFTINRARQFGKTTTLNELRKSLQNGYTVIGIDFQGIGKEGFPTGFRGSMVLLDTLISDF